MSEDMRHRIRVGDLIAFEPAQISGDKKPYTILSIDGHIVKVSTPEGFRLLPLTFLQQCWEESRLKIVGNN